MSTNKCRFRLLQLSLLLLVFGTPIPSTAESADSPSEPSASLRERLITLQLHEVPLNRFLQIVAEVKNLNVVPIDDTDLALVSANVVKTPIEEAVRDIFKNKNLKTKLDGNVLRIYRADNPMATLSAPAQIYHGEQISIDLCQVPLGLALEGVRRATGEKLPVPPPLQEGKKQSLRLIDVPWDQAVAILSEPRAESSYFTPNCSAAEVGFWQGTIYFRANGTEKRLLLEYGQPTWIVDPTYRPDQTENDPPLPQRANGSAEVFRPGKAVPEAKYKLFDSGWRKLE